MFTIPLTHSNCPMVTYVCKCVSGLVTSISCSDKKIGTGGSCRSGDPDQVNVDHLVDLNSWTGWCLIMGSSEPQFSKPHTLFSFSFSLVCPWNDCHNETQSHRFTWPAHSGNRWQVFVELFLFHTQGHRSERAVQCNQTKAYYNNHVRPIRIKFWMRSLCKAMQIWGTMMDPSFPCN